MGRRDYLTRLALGRSPFQASKAMNVDQTAFQSDLANRGGGEHVQLYNLKDRPINPETEARNADMRRAQNSVLALVGVVEQKERTNSINKVHWHTSQENRQRVVRAENERGEALGNLAHVVDILLTWSIDCLIERAQIGLYNPAEPFAKILSSEAHDLLSCGLKDALLKLFPGAVSFAVFGIGRRCSGMLVDILVSKVSEALWTTTKRLRRSEQEVIDGNLQRLEDALRLISDAALLPLLYYASAQRLSLAPVFPLLPPLLSLIPWHPMSVHTFGWISPVAVPGPLLLAKLLLRRDADSLSTCNNGQHTSYQNLRLYPRSFASGILFRNDPLGWILHKSWLARDRLMNWLGWRPNPPQHEQEDMMPPHQPTALASLPTRFIAIQIDSLFIRLLILPFDTIILRSIASSYTISPLPKSSKTITGSSYLTLVSDPRMRSIADTFRLASKVGLGLALNFAAKITVFSGLYVFTRWQGTNVFGWRAGEKAIKT
ncbi:hypothetical protein M433DRAFT_1241 [Acidomyces richmondensis BFW]|nr:MAG: hypothetical protein FE78DRAFT_34788 [Acidomyces sp. 'richmondensis']KYG49282.1 hypothetical protein M433DRAFT_1241 [Acidomyces richmondensis BFW]